MGRGLQVLSSALVREARDSRRGDRANTELRPLEVGVWHQLQYAVLFSWSTSTADNVQGHIK